jgi:two-component system osmolarity sensor histidine kinase EnvZ
MRLVKSKSYFWKIIITIGVVSVGFQIITLSTLAYYMVVPLGQRAAEDLASVITHAAETWHSLPANNQKVFSDRMFNKHELLISSSTEKLDDSTSLLPYLYFLETSLNKELGIKIQIKQTLGKDEQDWFWVDIPISDITVRFGFPRSRIGVNPPIAFFLLLTIGIFLTIVTAALLTQRLTIPIDRLYQAAQAMGKGHWPEPIKVDGPEELAVLTREFNRMNIQVKELLSNRTTLLAGIAHDLRTPLTQILDEGPGIPVEQSEAVFRPFYRLEKSRGSGTGGSGLGLAIVKQLADANKWAALLKPRNGGGTIAELVIPVKVKN